MEHFASTDNSFWHILSPIQNADCAKTVTLWCAEWLASVEQLVTLDNEDQDVVCCMMMSDKTRFELSGCVSTQIRCWCEANPCDLHLKPHQSQYECGKSAFVVIGTSSSSFFRQWNRQWACCDVRPKCMWWMKSFLQGHDVMTSNFAPFCTNKMEQRFLLLGSRWTLQGLFFECRRISRFDDIYWPARLPDTSACNLFFTVLH